MNDKRKFYIRELNLDGTACIYGPFNCFDEAQERIDSMVREYWADEADLTIITKPKSEKFIAY